MLNIYHASAGSGKTFQLTKDYIHLLFQKNGENLHRHILAVTFTNKATEEMKSRILKELFALAQGQPSNYRNSLMEEYGGDASDVNRKAKQILISLLYDYSSFSVSTIDSFFQQVIRSFAREIGIHGGYNLEMETDTVLSQAVDNLFFNLSKKENQQLLEWLISFAEESMEQSGKWNLKNDIVGFGSEIFKENYQYRAEEIGKKLHNRDFLGKYIGKLKKIRTNFEEEVKILAQEGINLMTNFELTHDDFSYKETKLFDKLISGNVAAPNSRFRKYAEDVENCTNKNTPDWVKDKVNSAYINGLGKCFEKINEVFEEPFIRYNSVGIVLKHIYKLGILSDLAMEINQLTAEQNTLLISDTNLLLNRIIDNSDTPYVYEKIGNKLQHFMIDEFQDTSVLQWKNFLPLVRNSLAEDKFNMVVGDVKQSIYRWRNSDWKLLDEQIFKDFSSEQIRQQPLKVNWRSDRNIVEFNNRFFTQTSQLLQQQLNDNIQEIFSVEKYPFAAELSTKIQHAYTDTEQKVSEKAGDGHVCIQFIPNEGKNWQEESLKRLPSILENFQDHGYKASDIAILVREKKDAAIIIQSLMNYKNSLSAKEGYCYDVLGNEGLVIGEASSVRFIIGLLKLLVSPSDDIQLAIVNIEYALNVLGKSLNEALRDISAFNENTKKNFSLIFNSEEEKALQEIRHYSLFDRVEQIISLFEIGKWKNQAPFVQAFQDLVYNFTAKGSSDISDFLTWWDETGCKKFVAMPADQEAIHIMTIHKAKGLDFPVVILPFCDWALEGNIHKTNVLWCETNVPPFNELPLLPISYVQYLKQSIFAQNYFEEQMHLYIDSLNLAYVAFTRPKNELVCLTPAPDEKKEEKKKKSASGEMKNISSVLWQFVQNQPNNNRATSSTRKDDENQIYEWGETTHAPQKENISSIKFEKFVQYPSCNSAQKLQIRHQQTQYLIEEKDLSDSQLNYGIIMHEILRKIVNKTDQDKVLQEFVLSGQISETERKTVEKGLEKFWSLPQSKEWFNGEGRILNESTILSPEGRQHRPDKVIIKDNKATVIDYKFGKKENKFYLSQVKEYIDLIAQMGYQTEGYVCYAELGKVVEVL